MNQLSGVQQAIVNLATEKLVVSYDDHQVTSAEIIKAVTDAGYQATEEVAQVQQRTKIVKRNKTYC